MARLPRFAKSARLVQTLVLFDGPQVALFKSDRNFDMLAVACDREKFIYPMFCVEVSDGMLRRYIDQKIDLNYVFRQKESHKRYYFLDWGKMKDRSMPLSRASAEEIKNNDFYPEPGFFAREHTSDVDLKRVVASSSRVFAIDGKWDAPDFSRFYAKIADVYAFAMLSSSNLKSQLNPVELASMKKSISDYAWKGGGSYKSFYSRLIDAVKNLNPLDVYRIAYASPGTIKVNGGEEPLQEVQKIMQIFSDRGEQLREQYTKLEKLLDREGIRGSDKDYFVSKRLEAFIKNESDELATNLGISDVKGAFEICSSNTSIYSKVVLSYYRRGRDLFSFQAQGRVAPPVLEAEEQELEDDLEEEEEQDGDDLTNFRP